MTLYVGINTSRDFFELQLLPGLYSAGKLLIVLLYQMDNRCSIKMMMTLNKGLVALVGGRWFGSIISYPL